MDERLFARLAARLQRGAVVLASVCDTRGATPRKTGSRMLVGADDDEFSVGGGEAEARVLQAARALLQGGDGAQQLQIDLSGREGAAGVCGGSMQLCLKRWSGVDDLAYAGEISAQLGSGLPVALGEEELGPGHPRVLLRPDPRLLIVGGGHCGKALHDLACHLDFELQVFEPRDSCFVASRFARATRAPRLETALETRREIYAVLLNRDMHGDVAALRVLAGQALAFLGMMGSRRRILEVRAALPELAPLLGLLRAPVGLQLDAQTPQEIAVSILAQLVQVRRQREQSIDGDGAIDAA